MMDGNSACTEIMSFQAVSINFAFLPRMWRIEHMKLNNNLLFKTVSLLSIPLNITMDAHTLSSLLHGRLHLSLLSL